jgi:hypothetical protein
MCRYVKHLLKRDNTISLGKSSREYGLASIFGTLSLSSTHQRGREKNNDPFITPSSHTSVAEMLPVDYSLYPWEREVHRIRM